MTTSETERLAGAVEYEGRQLFHEATKWRNDAQGCESDAEFEGALNEADKLDMRAVDLAAAARTLRGMTLPKVTPRPAEPTRDISARHASELRGEFQIAARQGTPNRGPYLTADDFATVDAALRMLAVLDHDARPLPGDAIEAPGGDLRRLQHEPRHAGPTGVP